MSDAGVSVPVGEGALPSEESMTGKSIAEFASKLASEDKEAYDRNFSALTKAGFKPEDYPAEFEKVRAAIAGGGK